eukprot:CAMPEP_0172159216 /NCGR_PEP_ID=MMETSP1050-20130122/4836_1 /TAXON_ID=233186 /ORGANISM="Cryptomonas curvata, Strain CCAP979/52" /LENGTH=156 /DNA_ID=CAMNT_0012828757 /DNA_START=19 /DNA_END=486 /DNA_ORIENTATION=-
MTTAATLLKQPTMTSEAEYRYQTPSPQPIIFDVMTSSLENDVQFFSAPKPRRQSKPGDIGWGLGLAEKGWYRENPAAMQARLSHNQVPAELKRVYHLESFRPPGCVLQARPMLPLPPSAALRVTSPSADGRFHRQPAGPSDIGAVGFSHRAVETIR